MENSNKDSFDAETIIKHNLPYDEELIIDENFEKYKNDEIYPPKPVEIDYDIGLGNFEYIDRESTKEMFTNAWQAITLTCMWSFVKQDIDSFMFSDDSRLDTIYKKMEELGYKGHSGSSFGITLRNMQFLVQNGEEEFKKLFVR